MDRLPWRAKAPRVPKHRLTLPEEAREQLESLIASYDRLRGGITRPMAGPDAEIAALKTKIADPAAFLWWTDLVQAEMCLLDATDDATLRSRLLGWRARMHDVIGDVRFGVYLTNAPNLATEVPAAILRADLGECIRTVYYFYSAYGISARSRTRASLSAMRVAFWILVAEGAAALVLALLTHATGWLSWIAIPAKNLGALEFALATSAAAVLGSVVSVQRRVQDPKVDADPFYRYIQTTADWVGIAVVPPVFGAVFGFVMYALLISQLMLGTLIKFDPQGTGVPVAPSDVALLLLLGFIAGFAEQLIPDALNRLAARALSTVSSTTVATSTTGGGAAQPAPKKPTVTTLKPSSAPAGTRVDITGSGFSAPHLTINFGTTAGSEIKADSDTALSVVVPAGTGTVPVTVMTDAGTSDPSPAARYTYAPATAPTDEPPHA